VTALYSLIAATAARRLGLTPTFAPLDPTRFHVDGRYNSHEAPDEQVVHITPGYSRDHRPDLNQVMLELIVEHQAGIPVRMKPLSGHSSAAPEFGQVLKAHSAQLHTTYGATYLVADSALYRADNLPKLAETQMKWLTRVPATLGVAQAVLAQADPQTLAPLRESSRCRGVSSTSGGVAQGWVLLYAAQRQPQAQRTVATQWRQQSDQDGRAFKRLGRTTFACAAEAQQALTSLTAGLQTTVLHASTVCPTPPYGKRGRPGPGTQPDQIVDHLPGALASQRTDQRARVDQQSGLIPATNALDAEQLSAQAVLDGYRGELRLSLPR
jgi:transposase